MKLSNPSVTAHKHGGHILFKPNNIYAALILNEIKKQLKIPEIKDSRYFVQAKSSEVSYLIGELEKKSLRIQIHKIIEDYNGQYALDSSKVLSINEYVNRSGLVKIFESYGLQVNLSETLINYLAKEIRRQRLENTAYPTAPTSTDLPLFERATVGTNLLCTKDYLSGNVNKLFTKGLRYMVVETGDETETVVISTNPVYAGQVVQLTGNGAKHKWTAFDPPMEEWFDDSTSTVAARQNVRELYPERVAQMQKKLDKLNLTLYGHVKEDVVCGALYRGSENCYLPRLGKAQPLSSKILTTTGWITMGEVTTNTLVIGSDGKPHKVVGIFPQGNKEVFEVTFSDKSKTHCTNEHLWSVKTPYQKLKSVKGNWQTVELKDIKDKLFDNQGKSKWSIPIVKPVKFPRQKLPLDPYVLGALIGDGCLKGSASFTSADPEIIDLMNARMPKGIKLHKVKAKYQYNPERNNKVRSLYSYIKDLNLDVTSEFKFIPEQYKFGSIQQRKDILAGLLDTDGSRSPNKLGAADTVEYSSISEKLVDDVIFIVNSLGGIARKSSRIPKYTHLGEVREGKRSYRITIKMPPNVNPFYLSRKREGYVGCSKFPPNRAFEAVIPIGKQECQCIAIDSKDHLYVTDDFVLTHNTSFAVAYAELAGSEKVAVLTTKNIRIFWEREFKRLKIKDYVMVNKLADLDKPGKYYVMTYNWLRSQDDDTYKKRKNHENYLKPAFKTTSKKVGKQVNVTQTPLYNYCPHCKGELERYVYNVDEFGRKTLEWVKTKGFMCRNKKCIPTTDNRKLKGAAWHHNKIITHKAGSYVDVYLAKHANCDPDSVKGRQCQECKQTDGVYRPGTFKRLKKRFTCVIADEIHNAKSIDTQTAEGLYALRAKRRLGLTGTPMSNSAMDTYWPFHWIFKGPTSMFPFSGLEGAKEYENKFCQHIYLDKPTGEKDEKGNEIIKTVRKRIPFLANPVQFWDFIGSKVIRRTYSDPLYQQSLIDAGQNLPTLEIKKLVCDMHPAQTKLMLSALQNFKNEFAQMVDDAEKNKRELNEALVISQMSALRSIATCPELMNERLGAHVYDGPNGGGKIANIDYIVKSKMAKGEKVVILSDFLDMQKACEAELLEFKPIRFQTNWDDEKREEAFREFSENKNKRVFIAGTRAVREGVDLSSANTVICCDLLWAPAFQMQAWSRAMAPTKDVRTCEVYLAISRNSLDEHMFNVFYSKMTAAEQAFDKKVLARRAQNVDIRFFVDRVLQDINTISLQVRDFDDGAVYTPSMNLEMFGERF